MKPQHTSQQSPDCSIFVEATLAKIKTYEVQKKSKQHIIHATLVTFLGYLLLINPIPVMKVQVPNETSIKHSTINLDLMRIKQQEIDPLQFGFYVGKDASYYWHSPLCS